MKPISVLTAVNTENFSVLCSLFLCRNVVSANKTVTIIEQLT